jgi:hypothetical protein
MWFIGICCIAFKWKNPLIWGCALFYILKLHVVLHVILLCFYISIVFFICRGFYIALMSCRALRCLAFLVTCRQVDSRVDFLFHFVVFIICGTGAFSGGGHSMYKPSDTCINGVILRGVLFWESCFSSTVLLCNSLKPSIF